MNRRFFVSILVCMIANCQMSVNPYFHDKGVLSKETMHIIDINDPSDITNQDFTCWLVTINSSLNT